MSSLNFGLNIKYHNGRASAQTVHSDLQQGEKIREEGVGGTAQHSQRMKKNLFYKTTPRGAGVS